MEIRRETAPANRQFRTKSGLPRPYKTKAPSRKSSVARRIPKPSYPRDGTRAGTGTGGHGAEGNIGDGNDGIVDGDIGDVRSSLLLVHGPGGGRRSESDGGEGNVVDVAAAEKRVTRAARWVGARRVVVDMRVKTRAERVGGVGAERGRARRGRVRWRKRTCARKTREERLSSPPPVLLLLTCDWISRARVITCCRASRLTFAAADDARRAHDPYRPHARLRFARHARREPRARPRDGGSRVRPRDARSHAIDAPANARRASSPPARSPSPWCVPDRLPSFRPVRDERPGGRPAPRARTDPSRRAGWITTTGRPRRTHPEPSSRPSHHPGALALPALADGTCQSSCESECLKIAPGSKDYAPARARTSARR